MLKIERINNGWTVENSSGTVDCFTDLRDLFNHLLLVLDGKGENFGGKSYGKIIIKLGGQGTGDE